jgi:hypothetical protein
VNKVIQLIRKDARHLWPWILTFWVLLALYPSSESEAARWMGSFKDLFFGLAPSVAVFLLVVAAVQQETLVGDRQYWLTRPFTKWHLMVSKALFFAVFIQVPVLLMQVVMLMMRSLPVWQSLPALLWWQFFFIAALVLLPAALASVSKGLGQAILAALFGLVALSSAGVYFFAAKGTPYWGSLVWIRWTAAFASVAAGATLVLLLQYTRRWTLLCRLLIALTAALMFAVHAIPPCEPAVAIQAALSPQRVDGVSIQFDSSRVGQRAPGWGTASNDPATVQVKIPIRIDGLAPGVDPVDDWTRVCVDLPAGGTWCSGWRALKGGKNFTRDASWLRAFVDREAFERVKNTPVRLHGSAAFTLLQRAGVVSVSSLERGAEVAGVGRCINQYIRMQRQSILRSVTCAATKPRAAIAVERARGESLDVGDLDAVYAPFAVAHWLSPWVRMQGPFIQVTADTPASWLIVKPVAHLRREFDFAGVRLADHTHPTP